MRATPNIFRLSRAAALFSAAVLAAALAFGAAATPGMAKAAARKKKEVVDPNSPQALHARLVAIKKAYRQGELNRSATWTQLTDLHEAAAAMATPDRVVLLETQAALLQEAGYPILAAIYASQSLKLAKDPLSPELTPLWAILRRTSEAKPIQNVLEIVSDSIDTQDRKVPVYGTDWNYFAGNAAAHRGATGKALAYYGQLKIGDRYFLPAKYEQAMLQIDAGKLADAEAALKAILFPTAISSSPLSEKTRRQMVDYAFLGLGRLYYEEQRFEDSIKMYRAVSRDGLSFYDALFEQSWAFFMGGYPMHSLGALYAVESPFYKEVFNPEAPLLRAMVHYWLCRYESSQNALADFTERYEPDVEKLTEFLGRQHLDPETAYTMFENLITGVSEQSLGVPRSILKTAAEKDSMLLVRDQYASIVEEKARLEAKGIFGSKARMTLPLEYMDRWEGALRKDIGKHFLSELTDMKKDYDRLYAQAQFLYVELLMSEKDQLLGKELHASEKITHVNKAMTISGWGNKTQAWKDARNGEYWWDEVGFYIEPVESMCQVPGRRH